MAKIADRRLNQRVKDVIADFPPLGTEDDPDELFKWVSVNALRVDEDGDVWIDPYAEVRTHRNTYEATMIVRFFFLPPMEDGVQDVVVRVDIQHTHGRWAKRPVPDDWIRVDELIQ